jgi:hypothetical protein
MQIYGIKLLPQEGDIEIDKVRLRLAQRIRLTFQRIMKIDDRRRKGGGDQQK